MVQDEGSETLIGYRLKRAQAALRSRMDEALRPLGLTTPQYSCLDAIERRPGASSSELARMVFVTRQTMTALLHGLVQRGLAKRTERTDAGRAIPMLLTDEGRRILTDASERVSAINETMVDALGPDLEAAVALGLSRCVEALENLRPSFDQ